MPAIGVVVNLSLQSTLSSAHIGRIPNLVSLDAALPFCVYGMHLQGLPFQEATWDHVSIIFSSRHLHECADTTSSRLTLANIVHCWARLHATQPHCVHSQGLPHHERQHHEKRHHSSKPIDVKVPIPLGSTICHRVGQYGNSLDVYAGLPLRFYNHCANSHQGSVASIPDTRVLPQHTTPASAYSCMNVLSYAATY